MADSKRVAVEARRDASSLASSAHTDAEAVVKTAKLEAEVAGLKERNTDLQSKLAMLQVSLCCFCSTLLNLLRRTLET